MEIKQLEGIEDNFRKIKLPDGKEVSYDITVLQKCLELAPEAIVLDLADSLVITMWDSYVFSLRCSMELLTSTIQDTELINHGSHDRLDFCRLIKDDTMQLKGFYKDSIASTIDLTNKKLLFTTNRKDFIEYSSNVVFKEDDVYFLYETSESVIKILAYQQVDKDGCTYFRGFNDDIIMQKFQSTTIMKKYLGSFYQDMSLKQLYDVLNGRLKCQRAVERTFGTGRDQGDDYIAFEPCFIEPEVDCLKVTGLITGRSFDKVTDAEFTTDTWSLLNYCSRRGWDYNPQDVKKGYYYLHKVHYDKYHFIANNLYEVNLESGENIYRVEGFEYKEDLYNALKIPMDNLIL